MNVVQPLWSVQRVTSVPGAGQQLEALTPAPSSSFLRQQLGDRQQQLSSHPLQHRSAPQQGPQLPPVEILGPTKAQIAEMSGKGGSGEGGGGSSPTISEHSCCRPRRCEHRCRRWRTRRCRRGPAEAGRCAGKALGSLSSARPPLRSAPCRPGPESKRGADRCSPARRPAAGSPGRPPQPLAFLMSTDSEKELGVRG